MKEYSLKNNDLVEDFYLLSDIQEGMLYYSLRNPGEYLYHEQVGYIITDEQFNFEVFKSAFSIVLRKHPILRTKVNIVDYKFPIQIVLKQVAYDFELIDINHLNRLEQKKYLKKYFEEDLKGLLILMIYHWLPYGI